MVTNYPQQLAATAEPTRNAATDSTIFGRAITRVGQVLCGIGGHDSVLHVEGRRVMMRCTSCGHDTPGWEVSGRGPRRRYEGDASRHRLGRTHLALRKSA